MAAPIFHALFVLILLDTVSGMFQYTAHVKKELRDEYAYAITLGSVPFIFLGKTNTQIHISDNGWLGFNDSFKGGDVHLYTLAKQWISVYGFNIGADRTGGFIYINPDTTPTTTQIDAVKGIIRKNYDSASSFTPTALVISTWVNVHQEADTNRTPTSGSTFQAAVASDGTETWVIFQYDKLTHEPGVIGVSAGDGINNWKVCSDASATIANQGVTKDQLMCTGGFRPIVFPIHGTAWNQGSQCIQYDTDKCSHVAVVQYWCGRPVSP